MDSREPSRGTKEPHPEEDEGPLVPEHIVDQASQRLFIVSMFVLIQCWKVYDVLLVKADAYALLTANVDSSLGSFTSLNNFTFVMKYVIFDGLFLWLLPVLNIPLLTFLPLVTILLTCVVNAFTLLLASNSALPLLSSLVLPVWNSVFKQKELTIVGDSATSSSVIDINAHFKGKYTVQYLPASSVHFNPFAYGDLCLEADLASALSMFSPVIHVPIEFNTTNDVGYMQIQHMSPDNSVSILNYTQNDIHRFQKRDYSHLAKHPNYASDDRVFYVEIDVTKPGRYKIHRVSDVDGMVIRPVRSDFTVGHCPSAKFVYPGVEDSYTTYKCLTGSTSDIDWNLPLISSFGVYPVTVELAFYHNGRKLNSFNTTITEPDLGTGLLWLQSKTISRNVLERELLRNSNLINTNRPGKYTFGVLAVFDKLGNKRLYNPASQDRDVKFTVELKQSGSIALVDRDPESPLLVNLLKRLMFDIRDKLAFPVTLSVGFQPESGSPVVTNYTFLSADDLRKGLEVTKPGIYRIISGQDNSCPCNIVGGAVAVKLPEPPSVEITGTPITDKCVGLVGFEFDLNFRGKAPFEIQYEVFKNVSGLLKPILSERGLKQHLKRASSHEFSFQYKPRQEGNYVLTFKGIKDVNYNKQAIGIPTEGNTFSTYFHKRSQFSINNVPRDIEICKGGVVEVPVNFEGNFPFSFKYSIVNTRTGKAIKSEKVKDLFDNSYVIKSPTFDKGGNYEIVFNSVTDHLGCPADSPSKAVTIHARSEIPRIGFTKSEVFTIVEGNAVKVPIKLISSVGFTSEDKITYSKTDVRNSNDVRKVVLSGASELRIKEEGVYQLESFVNKGCSGEIENKDLTVTVQYYPRPNLTVIPDPSQVVGQPSDRHINLKAVCQDTTQDLKVTLQGQKPFIIRHNIKYPSGKVESSQLTIDNHEFTLPLPSSQKGRYEHSFVAIYDALYTKGKVASQLAAPVISYEVRGRPSLRVVKPYIQMCESQVSEELTLQLPVTFEGQYPFSVKGKARHIDGGKSEEFEITDINEPKITIAEISEQLQLSKFFSVGEHVIEFEELLDGYNCRRQKLRDDNRVTVSITRVPSIRKQLPQGHYCVGDHIAYNMSGISPFVVFYSFNGQNRKAELGHEFVRLASKPGELAIGALQDSSASLCLVNFTKDESAYNALKLQVHDLPSVEISQGDSIIKNLHEGDQTEVTFTFTGVAPFEVTYVRTLGGEEGRSKRNKSKAKTHRRVVETKTIKDIWDYEYSILVSLEGTYEAVRIADAFCVASRSIEEIL